MNDLYDHLAFWAKRGPHRPCIVEADSGRRITYRECFTAVQAMRQWLGSPPCSIIAPIHGEILDALLWLAALTGGHLLVPLGPDAGAQERTRAASMFEPDILILEDIEQASGFPSSDKARILTRAECEKIIKQAQVASGTLNPYTGSVCLMTSGTTGQPKGVVLDAERIAWTADHVRTSHRLTKNDVGLTPLPLFHVNGPVVGLCASVMAGSTIVIAKKFSRSRFWSWVETHHVTWASIVPAIVAMLLGTDRPDFLPGAMRFVRTGAAPLPSEDMHAFESKFGIPVVETYGLTEAASMVTANPVPPGEQKECSAGLPVGVELRVCRPRRDGHPILRDVRPGETGEICIQGPGVVTGYYGDAGSEAFQDGWFRTGDLGYRDEQGYVFIGGRLRDIIIRGGESIAPREIEEILEAHSAVREAAVIGRPDRLLGEQVIAYLILNEPMDMQLEQALREHVAAHVSRHKVPVEFIGVEELPRNEMGKLQHSRLKQRDAAVHGWAEAAH